MQTDNKQQESSQQLPTPMCAPSAPTFSKQVARDCFAMLEFKNEAWKNPKTRGYSATCIALKLKGFSLNVWQLELSRFHFRNVLDVSVE